MIRAIRGPFRRSALGALAAALALLALAGPLRAEGALPGFAPLAASPHAALAPYLGKIAALPDEPAALPGGAETCSAVVVAPRWILTAAHCVHARRPDQPPWTPAHFGPMLPLDRLMFRQAPMGSGPVYRIVGHVKSAAFPDPAAAAEDWILLRLHRPVAVTAAGMPRLPDPDSLPDPGTLPDPGGPPGAEADLRISGFVRVWGADGRLDIGASNTPWLSLRPCRTAPHDDRTFGALPGLLAADCVPAAALGLSGAPLLALPAPGGDPRPRLLAIQTGAGLDRETGRRVPVLVGADRFAAALRAVIAEDGDQAPGGPGVPHGTTPPATAFDSGRKIP
jgi:hypothetical protein